jgi:hypothetical protein
MRLLNTRTLRVEEFVRARPEYAILSHTWGQEEISFQELERDRGLAETKAGYRKIQGACEQALRRGYDHIWIDTCCIDKSSSSELQEAINSMYRWYQDADECLVYLADMPGDCPFLDTWDAASSDPWFPSARAQQLATCSWFTRGWTLQEIIAPKSAQLFGARWNHIGNKAGMERVISEITGIPTTVLSYTQSTYSLSVAKRMSWAAKRQTSRVEDRAYSLLGILGVNMPLLYGEGPRAFVRLQEEVIKISDDQTIFAWSSQRCDSGCLLADSPAAFANDSNLISWGRPGAFEMTNQGLRMTAPVMYCEDGDYREFLAVLNCRYEENFGGCLAFRLGTYDHTGEDSQHFHVATDEVAILDYLANISAVQDGAESHHLPGKSGRLAFIDVDLLKFATRRQIHLSRTIEIRRRQPDFRVNFTTPSCSIEIIQAVPESCWRAGMKTMQAPKAPTFRAGVVLRRPSGSHALLVCGYDTAGPDLDRDSTNGWIIPGVYLHDTPGNVQMQEIAELSFKCRHSIHETQYDTTNGCPHTHLKARLEQDGEPDTLVARLREKKGSGTLYVVDVGLETLPEDYLDPNISAGNHMPTGQST